MVEMQCEKINVSRVRFYQFLSRHLYFATKFTCNVGCSGVLLEHNFRFFKYFNIL